VHLCWSVVPDVLRNRLDDGAAEHSRRRLGKRMRAIAGLALEQ
jgi:hypothetical protein